MLHFVTKPVKGDLKCEKNTVSPAGLEVPHLGPKWGKWVKKLGCASNPPVCRLLVWEDWMRTRVFFAHLPHLGPSGGNFKASRRNCMLTLE